MFTTPDLELRSKSLICDYTPYGNTNKHEEKIIKDNERLQRVDAKWLREFNQTMVEATKNTRIKVFDALDNKKANVLLGAFTNISAEDAMHIPFNDCRIAA